MSCGLRELEVPSGGGGGSGKGVRLSGKTPPWAASGGSGPIGDWSGGQPTPKAVGTAVGGGPKGTSEKGEANGLGAVQTDVLECCLRNCMVISGLLVLPEFV